jgi:hypothetical protein
LQLCSKQPQVTEAEIESGGKKKEKKKRKWFLESLRTDLENQRRELSSISG